MADTPTDPDTFDAHLASWQQWQREPWGRLRYSVVWQVLERHLGRLEPADPAGLRVLDIGGGDGAESLRLAALGHAVTLLDSSAGMLAFARRAAAERQVEARLTTLEGSLWQLDDLDLGDFDLVLCHFVVQYLERPADAVAVAARRLRPGGLLSLIAPNPASEVLTKAIRDLDLDAAHGLLGAERFHVKSFDRDVARISPQQAEDYVRAAGLDLEQRYGGRIVLDLIADNAVKYEPATFAAIERLEFALCDVSPYRDIGRFWQVVASRPLARRG
jgi:S-adenosylmethionine-dependent methyltransferase